MPGQNATTQRRTNKPEKRGSISGVPVVAGATRSLNRLRSCGLLQHAEFLRRRHADAELPCELQAVSAQLAQALNTDLVLHLRGGARRRAVRPRADECLAGRVVALTRAHAMHHELLACLVPFESCDCVVRLDVVHRAPEADLHDYERRHDADDLNKPAIEYNLVKIGQRATRTAGK